MMIMTDNGILMVVLVVITTLVVVVSESQIIKTLHQTNDSQIITMFHDDEGDNGAHCIFYMPSKLEKVGLGIYY